MNTYYLKIEARYTVQEDSVDEDGESTQDIQYITKTWFSDPFSDMQSVISFGNAWIEKNLWLEQYPGYIGCRLKRGYGRPLAGFSLKNGAQVFISVETHDTPDPARFTMLLDFLKDEE